jgi:CheY-like chemotaxis protein
MESLPLPLHLLIVDSEALHANVLAEALRSKPGVEAVGVVTDADRAVEILAGGVYNSVFIDIFSLGTTQGVQLIDHIRRTYPVIPICLYSDSGELADMDGIPEKWRTRFSHYFRLFKDQSVSALQASVERSLKSLAYELQANIARDHLSEVGNKLRAGDLQQLPKEVNSQLQTAISEAVIVLEQRQHLTTQATLVPGVPTGKMGQLIDDTLQEAKRSLQLTARVNIGVLCAGSLLAIGSFIVASLTQDWQAVAFGGFGMAGVIASLITNPLKSISLSARRLVQLQVAYLSFTSQLSMLNQAGDTTPVLEKSKQLGEQMALTLEKMETHFG